MSDKEVNAVIDPVAAAYQVMLEMVKAGAFNGEGARGRKYTEAFTVIKDYFVDLSKKELSKNN